MRRLVLLLAALGWGGMPLRAAEPPVVLVGPQGGTVAAGQDFGFSVLAGGTPPFSYQWFLEETPIPGAEDLTLVLFDVGAAQSGAYSVLVSNAVGSVRSAAATLTVIDPVILHQPVGGSVAAGGSFTNTVSAAGTPPLGYQWFLDGEPLPGQIKSSLELTGVTLAQAGAYSVMVSNVFGSVVSAAATLKVGDPVILIQPEGGAVVAGTNFTFLAVAGGLAPFTNQWCFNGEALTEPLITSETTNLLELTGLTAAQSGTYLLEVRNAAGSVRSQLASLVVSDPVIVAQPEGGTVVAGTNFTFQAVAGGHPPFTNRWLFNGAALTDPVVTTETTNVLELTALTAAQSGAYSLEVRNAAGSVVSQPANLVVLDPVILVQPEGGAANVGEEFRFTAVAGGLPPFTYQWYLNGAALFDPLTTSETTNTLTLTGLTTAQSGAYLLEVRNAAGSVRTRPANLIVYDLAILAQPQGGWVVGGGDFAFAVQAAGVAPFTYQWYYEGQPLAGQTGPRLELREVTTGDSGVYVVRVSNSLGSVSSGSARLLVLDPVIVQQPRSTRVATGSDYAFTVVAGGSPPFTYQWYTNGVAAGAPVTTADTSNVLELTSISTGQGGAYWVTVSNAAGMVLSDTASLTVSDLIILLQPSDGQVVAGGDFTNSVRAFGTPPLSYQWHTNGVPLPGQTASNLVLRNVTAAQAGSYSVLVSNALDSLWSEPARLTVVDPAIVVQPQGGRAWEGEYFRFEVEAAGSEPIVYQWYFNGIQLPGQIQPSLELADVETAHGGLYSVQVQNAQGSLTSAGANLTVGGEVPRAIFTGGFSTNEVGRWQLRILFRGNGQENAMSFTLSYDPLILSNPIFLPSAEATSTVDNSQLAEGRVGVRLHLPPRATFVRTNQQVVGTFEFDLLPGQNPYMSGFSFATEPVPPEVTDRAGRSLSVSLALRPSGILLQPEPALDLRSGLFTQRLLVSNPTLLASSFSNVIVDVYGLGLTAFGDRIRLYNRQVTGEADPDQNGVVDTPTSSVQLTLPQGQAVLATMEYYVQDQLTVPRPSYSFAFGEVAGLSVPPNAVPIGIRAVRYVEGLFLVEFNTQPDRFYYIQYADRVEALNQPDMVKTAFPGLAGTGGTMQWIDNGPPKTESAPINGMRFYQVLETQ